MMLQLAAEECMDETIENEQELRQKISEIAGRFVATRALRQSRIQSFYLSIVNELDVYVATSMRRRDDFRNMARDCEYIFNTDALKSYDIRYFDPTLSAAEGS